MIALRERLRTHDGIDTGHARALVEQADRVQERRVAAEAELPDDSDRAEPGAGGDDSPARPGG